MADDNNNVLGIQTVTDDVMSNNDVLSHNDASTNTETDLDLDNVGNDYSDNSDNSDNSTDVDLEVEIEDSFNKDESVRTVDSHNITTTTTTTFQTLNENTVGVRQYNTGFGDLNLGGLTGMSAGKSYGHGGGAGDVDVSIDNRSLQLDQSVNQMIETGHGGDVNQDFSQDATVAFGDGSMAAGDDLSFSEMNIDVTIGDISMGNTWTTTTISDSFQDNSVENEWEMDVDIDESFNDESTHTDLDVEIEDSFTSEVDATFENSWEWENEGNIFSPGAAANDSEAGIIED